MAFVYLLKSLKDLDGYIGSTPDLERRYKEHEDGQVLSTKNRRPLILRGYRGVDSIVQARILEHQYKRSHDKLLRDIKNGLFKMFE